MARTRKRRCPQCHKAFQSRGVADTASYPFCSEKCKLLDLGTWLSDGYAVMEDLSRGNDLVRGLPDPKSVTDPDVRAALEELEDS